MTSENTELKQRSTTISRRKVRTTQCQENTQNTYTPPISPLFITTEIDLKNKMIANASVALACSGTMLIDYPSKEAKLAGVLCFSLGFFGKQALDTYVNHNKRALINNKYNELNVLSANKANQICPPPTDWYDEFGLDTKNWKNILPSIINMALELCVIGLTLYTASVDKEEPFSDKDVSKILLCAIILSAVLLNQMEQYFKASNLQRREYQLEQGISRFKR